MPKRISLRTVLTALLTSVAFAQTGGLYDRTHRSQPLTDKDTVVLADFANTTGDPIFDDTLRPGLIVSLRQSPFLNVLDDREVANALHQMTLSLIHI